jgi:CHAD domain-containing protein
VPLDARVMPAGGSPHDGAAQRSIGYDMVVSGSKNGMRPVLAFTAQVEALGAAMLVALASAEVGAVHKLRTATRRVEAQMTLLEALATGPKPLPLPPHADEVAAVKKRLRKVRRAAGAVRDLDVQCDSIRMDAPVKTEVDAGTPGDTIRKDAKKLRKYLEGQREHEVATLLAVLRREEQKLASSLLVLETVLKPARLKVVTQPVLVDRMEHWFTQVTHAVLRIRIKDDEQPNDALQRAVEALNEDALHAIRKAAKLARYMAESTPEGSPAYVLAEQFEAMQEAGGTWHDWLMLEQLSAEFHGKRAPLTERYRNHRDAALAEYHLKLVELLPTATE